MAKLVTRCPSCEGDLQVTRLDCTSCKTHLEGSFELPPLVQLGAEDLAFVSAFVRSSGSLKAMASQLGISYPTVRNRLDDILARLAELERGVEKKRHAILDAVENGKLTAQAAAEELRKVAL